jgi:hypothetical protein
MHDFSLQAHPAPPEQPTLLCLKTQLNEFHKITEKGPLKIHWPGDQVWYSLLVSTICLWLCSHLF